MRINGIGLNTVLSELQVQTWDGESPVNYDITQVCHL